MKTFVPATAADVRDQRWLADRLNDIENGIEAVLDIARNWDEIRCLSRLHPGVSAQDYILAHVKSPLGRGVVVPLLEGSNWSQAQIAAIAGVSTATVSRTVANVTVERPAETLGADGKLRPAQVVRTVEAEIIETDDAVQPATPSQTQGRPVLRAFRHDLERIRTEYGEFRTMRKYAALFAAIDEALEH